MFEKNSDLHLRKVQICFVFEKNSDLHLRKIHICFVLIFDDAKNQQLSSSL